MSEFFVKFQLYEMLINKTDCKHIFYHADRSASLKEHQEIELAENGLSYLEHLMANGNSLMCCGYKG